jgi:hypothetical protein
VPFQAEETIGPGGGPKLRHRLVVTAPGQPPRQVSLSGTLTIGRIPPAGLVLPYPEISRRHAEISLAGGEAVITDLGSTNGVWIEGRQITGPTPLAPGTQLRLGHVLLLYEAEAEPEAMTAAPPIPAGGRLDDPLLQVAWQASGPRDVLHAASLGGRLFAGFALTLSGPERAAAVQAASIAQALREGLPGADRMRPADGLTRLGTRLAGHPQEGLVPSLWCWSYDPAARVLEYCSAGHPPGFLLAPDGQAVVALDKRNPAPGLMPDFAFVPARLKLRPGCALYLFGSDLFARPGAPWGLAEATPLLRGAGGSAPQEVARLCGALGEVSVAVLQFP